MKDINSVKQQILDILKNVKRKNIESVINFLVEGDFFTAPASTRFHGNFEGGLAEHSLNVYEIFKRKNEIYDLGLSEDTVTIVSLLHDICKVDFYTVYDKNVNIAKAGEKPRWVKMPAYGVNDLFPAGHGEKSVIILQRLIGITREESLIIRWHMGGYEPKENYNSISIAWNMYKAGAALHTADLESSYILETHVEPGENPNQIKM